MLTKFVDIIFDIISGTGDSLVIYGGKICVEVGQGPWEIFKVLNMSMDLFSPTDIPCCCV